MCTSYLKFVCVKLKTSLFFNLIDLLFLSGFNSVELLLPKKTGFTCVEVNNTSPFSFNSRVAADLLTFLSEHY